MEWLMNPLRISPYDFRIWALGLASFPGGYGSGRPSNELNSTGGLYGWLPISQIQLYMMLDTIGALTKTPDSAWDRIPEFSKFLISVDTWHFSTSLFRRTWATRIGFVFGEGRGALWVDSVRWFSTPDIPIIFQSLELAAKRGQALPPLDQKLQSMMT
jgi:hypothetical protein